jgi:hypothetical protein
LPVVIDNCDPNPLLTSNFVIGAAFPVGTTAVNYNSFDSSGNQAFCSFTVTVVSNLTASAQVNNNSAIDLNITGGTAPYSFQWSGPNGFTGSSEDISGLTSGVYNVTVTDANGCNFELNETVQNVSANLTITNDFEVKFYPNPAKNELNVELLNGAYELELFDALGRRLLNLSFSAEKYNLDLSTLNTGVYYCKVFDIKNGKSHIQKITKI